MSDPQPSIIFVAPGLPWPLDSGVHQRQYHILQALSQVGPVDFLSLPRRPDGAVPAEIQSLCREVQVHPLPPRPENVFVRLRDLCRRLAGSTLDGRRLPPRLARQLNQPDGHRLVWIERLNCAASLRHPGGPNVILDLDDVEHRKLFESRIGRRLTGWRYLRTTLEARAWRSAEWDAVRRFARVIVCRDDDRRFLGADNVSVVANGVAAPDVEFTPGLPGRMLFVGLMSFLANDDAMRYFVADILPRIRQRVPGANLDIVGWGVSDELKSLSAGQPVRICGFVEDIGACYADAAISVVPLRVASGTTIKILESLARRTAVVASPRAVEGLDLTPGVHVELADSPEQFADCCVRLLGDASLRRRLADAGSEQVRRLYAWPVVQRRIQELAREVMG